jgi:hypothetical protein
VIITEIIFFDTNKAKLVVEIPETEIFHTAQAPRVPRILFKLFPHMVTQRCHNGAGLSFRREAEATEIPHLFEHLILEIQDQVRRHVGNPFRGETHWNWTIDPRGRYYVTFDYDDEMVALGAIRLAERVINALDSREAAQLDMPREIGRLRDLARLARSMGGKNGFKGGRRRPEAETSDDDYEPDDEEMPTSLVLRTEQADPEKASNTA